MVGFNSAIYDLNIIDMEMKQVVIQRVQDAGARFMGGHRFRF